MPEPEACGLGRGRLDCGGVTCKAEDEGGGGGWLRRKLDFLAVAPMEGVGKRSCCAVEVDTAVVGSDVRSDCGR